MVDFTTTPIFAEAATSGEATDTSVSFDGTTTRIGTDTPMTGIHTFLRFPTGAFIANNLTIVDSKLRVNVSGNHQPTLDTAVWASEFGTTVNQADYNQAASNVYGGNTGANGTLRVRINRLTAANAQLTDGQLLEVVVPSRFVYQGAGSVSDFEIRPDQPPSFGATALTLHGAANSVGANRPRLVGYAYTDEELQSTNAFRTMALGAESFVSFAPEATRGVPVKTKVFLDMVTSSLDSMAENLQSQSLTSQRARPRKVAVGREGAGGSITFEVTPERWPLILLGIFKPTGTTGSHPGPYTTTFKLAKSDEIKTFTFVQGHRLFRMVYPGAMIGGISFNTELDEFVTASVDVMAQTEYTYDRTASGVDDVHLILPSASYDSVENNSLTFVGAQVKIGGSTLPSQCIRNFNLSISQNVQEKRGLTRQRKIVGHYALGCTVEASFQMYFENESQLRTFLGVAHKDFPYAAEKKIEFQSVEVSYEGIRGLDLQEIKFTLPKMMYTAMPKTIDSEDAIMIDCTGMALLDLSEDSNVVVTVRNSQPGTFYDVPANPELITVLPAGR